LGCEAGRDFKMTTFEILSIVFAALLFAVAFARLFKDK